MEFTNREGIPEANAELGSEIREATSAITASALTDKVLSDRLLRLVIAGSPGTARSISEWRTVRDAALERFADALRDVIEILLLDVIEIDDEHLTAIRRFFLEPPDAYSIEELATLWQLPPADVRNIYHDELLQWSEAHPEASESPRIAWEDAIGASNTFNLLRPGDVERALGGDFNRARSESWRTVPVFVRLPIFIAESLPSAAYIGPSQNLARHVERFILELFEGESSRDAPRAQRRSGTPPDAAHNRKRT